MRQGLVSAAISSRSQVSVMALPLPPSLNQWELSRAEVRTQHSDLTSVNRTSDLSWWSVPAVSYRYPPPGLRKEDQGICVSLLS